MCTDQESGIRNQESGYCLAYGALKSHARGADNNRFSVLSPQSSVLSTRSSERGVSLIELLMFIVIVSVAVAGILLVMDTVSRSSADPLIRKQALAIGESMLEEIRLQPLSGVACTGTLAADAPRTGVSSVCDYDGYSTTAGIRDFSTNAVIAGLTNYNIANVSVAQIATLGGTVINAGSGVSITVTVADSSGAAVDATGYRAGK